MRSRPPPPLPPPPNLPFCRSFVPLLHPLLLPLLLLLLMQHCAVAEWVRQGCVRQDGRPLCCEGRNFSCKSSEPPGRPIYRVAWDQQREVPPEVLYRDRSIGQMLLPGFVALDERGVEIARQLGCLEHFRLYEANRRLQQQNQQGGRRKRRRRKRNAQERGQQEQEQEQEETLLQFGWPWEEWAEYDRLESDQRNWPIVRYSLLSRFLPLRIVKRRLRVDSVPTAPKGRQVSQLGVGQLEELSAGDWRVLFLAESHPDCFCDQMCTDYGDCCPDYAARCPPLDCQVSGWHPWADCVPDNGASCGVGVRERRRFVLRERLNAGAECPKLTQQIGCFRECRPGQAGHIEEDFYRPPDVTTVALLLDYRYNKSREELPRQYKTISGRKQQKSGRKNRREVANADEDEQKMKREDGQRRRENVKYCVHYDIEWLNRNCVEKEWSLKLAKGRRVCAECQPEAQYHRPRPRCASDLEDGQTGFWKLIGPKSCYGIWKRLHANTECDCAEHFPELSPFLLV